MEKKICRKCGTDKPIEEFRLSNRKRSAPGAREAQCKDCQRAAVRAYGKKYRADPENLEKRREKWRRDNQLESRKSYQKNWREENLEKARGYGRAYYDRNREEGKKRAKEWRENNPAKHRAKAHHARARKLGRIPAWVGEKELQEMLSFFEESVRLEKETGERWSVDHIYPLCGKLVCGLHVKENLQVLTLYANTSMGRAVGRGNYSGPNVDEELRY